MNEQKKVTMDPNTDSNHLLQASFSDTFIPLVCEIKAVESWKLWMAVIHFSATLHSQAELMFIELNQIVREIRKHCWWLMPAWRSAMADSEKPEDYPHMGWMDGFSWLVDCTSQGMKYGKEVFATGSYRILFFCIYLWLKSMEL